MIPREALGQHMAILGRTGSGKTYAAKGGVETLLREGRRVCIIDPTSSWWGLRSSADGKEPGFPVVVFGGEHADVPITAESGERLAAIIAERNLPCVVDLSDFGMGERHRFMASFLSTLHRHNRRPLHLVIDEADEAAPQNPLPETRRVLHEVDRLVRRGRVKGFVVTLITQRPAVLHKNVLSQASTLIAMRMMAPQDRSAIEAWVEAHADKKTAATVLDSLPRLQPGEGWIWSPELGLLERVKFPPITTFDSSRTPDEDEVAEPVAAAAIDLGDLREALGADADAVAEPIGEDERKKAFEEGREVGRMLGYQQGQADQQKIINTLVERVAELEERLDAIAKLAAGAVPAPTDERQAPYEAGPPATDEIAEKNNSKYSDPIPAPPKPAAPERRHEGISRPQQRILDALAWLDTIGIRDADRTQLALLADASPKSSAFANNLGALHSGGFVSYPVGKRVALTPKGARAANRPERPPTSADLHAMIRSKVSGPQWAILSQLIGVFPHALKRERLAHLAGASAQSSAYANNLGRLHSLGLICYPARGEVAAQPVLFVGRQ